MHCVYAHLVIILVKLLQYFWVQLDKIWLEYFILIQGERIFNCHTLNVFLALFLLIHLTWMKALRILNGLHILYEFVENGYIFKFFNLNLKGVLHLFVRSAIELLLPSESIIFWVQVFWNFIRKQLWLFIIFSTLHFLSSGESHLFLTLFPSFILFLFNDYIVMVVTLAGVNTIRGI